MTQIMAVRLAEGPLAPLHLSFASYLQPLECLGWTGRPALGADATGS